LAPKPISPPLAGTDKGANPDFSQNLLFACALTEMPYTLSFSFPLATRFIGILLLRCWVFLTCS
jgi:hypothetical protein